MENKDENSSVQKDSAKMKQPKTYEEQVELIEEKGFLVDNKEAIGLYDDLRKCILKAEKHCSSSGL